MVTRGETEACPGRATPRGQPAGRRADRRWQSRRPCHPGGRGRGGLRFREAVPVPAPGAGRVGWPHRTRSPSRGRARVAQDTRLRRRRWRPAATTGGEIALSRGRRYYLAQWRRCCFGGWSPRRAGRLTDRRCPRATGPIAAPGGPGVDRPPARIEGLATLDQERVDVERDALVHPLEAGLKGTGRLTALEIEAPAFRFPVEADPIETGLLAQRLAQYVEPGALVRRASPSHFTIMAEPWYLWCQRLGLHRRSRRRGASARRAVSRSRAFLRVAAPRGKDHAVLANGAASRWMSPTWRSSRFHLPPACPDQQGATGISGLSRAEGRAGSRLIIRRWLSWPLLVGRS